MSEYTCPHCHQPGPEIPSPTLSVPRQYEGYEKQYKRQMRNRQRVLEAFDLVLGYRLRQRLEHSAGDLHMAACSINGLALEALQEFATSASLALQGEEKASAEAHKDALFSLVCAGAEALFALADCGYPDRDECMDKIRDLESVRREIEGR